LITLYFQTIISEEKYVHNHQLALTQGEDNIFPRTSKEHKMGRDTSREGRGGVIYAQKERERD
jgi:hypothetical protein